MLSGSKRISISVNGSDVPVTVNLDGAFPVLSVNGLTVRIGLTGIGPGVGLKVGSAFSRRPAEVGVADTEAVGVGLPNTVPFVIMVGVIFGQMHVPDE